MGAANSKRYDFLHAMNYRDTKQAWTKLTPPTPGIKFHFPVQDPRANIAAIILKNPIRIGDRNMPQTELDITALRVRNALEDRHWFHDATVDGDTLVVTIEKGSQTDFAVHIGPLNLTDLVMDKKLVIKADE